VKVGDLVVYRWWHGDQSPAHMLSEGQKNSQMAIVISFPSQTQGIEYVRIYITGIDSRLDVPIFKLEAAK
jgi:hypothetical protein